MRRPAPLRRLQRAWWVLAAVGLAGCEFVVVDWYYIDATRVLGTRAEVVELGPIYPERVGFDPLDTPISEPMPGDRLRLEPIVVDGDGREVDPESIDALWFQCGPLRCGDLEAAEMVDSLADVDEACSEQAGLTMDMPCRLGSGGGFEFEVPAVGPMTALNRYAYYYMVAALDDSRTAEECWAARLDSDESLSGCAFADRELKVGPSWLLLLVADAAGLPTDVPISEIPGPAFLQPANRVPYPAPIELTSDGDVIMHAADSPAIPARPGQRFVVGEPLWREVYDWQSYFVASPTEVTEDTWVFVVWSEVLWLQWYTSGSLIRLDEGLDAGYVDLQIDELAKPGTTSRLVLLWGDDRGSMDMRVIEFEVSE